MEVCVIFGAGETYAPRVKFKPTDIVIAADGGYAAAVAAGYEPKAVIGDFDSGEVPKSAAHVIKLNRDKDDTDMLAAVKLGLRRGYKTFVLYGGVGGRLDHTVANFSVLAYLNAFGAHGYLIDRDSVATVITDESFTLPKTANGFISVFAYGGAASGVSIDNVKFPLSDAELTTEFPLGVSNEPIGTRQPKITVKHGSLLVFFPRKP